MTGSYVVPSRERELAYASARVSHLLEGRDHRMIVCVRIAEDSPHVVPVQLDRRAIQQISNISVSPLTRRHADIADRPMRTFIAIAVDIEKWLDEARPAAWSLANGVLGPNVLAIGASSVTPDELRILADSGAHVAHSPAANMKMATGIFPLPEALTAGVCVALGTDGGLNNNTHDMFAEMKTGALLHNATQRFRLELGVRSHWCECRHGSRRRPGSSCGRGA